MPKSTGPTAAPGRATHRRWDRDSDAMAAILAAARSCFSRYGVHRTTMEDIAKEAGIARQYLYRFVSGREELVTAVASDRIQEIIQTLQAVVEKGMTFSEAMVELSVGAIELVRNDPELRNLLETTPNLNLHEMLVGPNPVIHDLALAFYAPLFAAARANGDLRADADDDEIVEWIRGVYLMMILRQDLDPDRERAMIRKFFLPSLLRASAAAR